MAKHWEDMTTHEKLEWLRDQDHSNRKAIAGISARLDEVGGVVVELERQLKELQATIADPSGRPRPTIMTSPV